MTNSTKSFITFGVQAGDKEANAVVAPLYMRLRKLLAERSSRGYGQSLKELAFVLRIDGVIWHWDKSGCENLRAKRSGEATVDIFMPADVWQQRDDMRIQRFLVEETRRGFSLMLERLNRLGVSLDKDSLVADFESAIVAFESNYQ